MDFPKARNMCSILLLVAILALASHQCFADDTGTNVLFDINNFYNNSFNYSNWYNITPCLANNTYLERINIIQYDPFGIQPPVTFYQNRVRECIYHFPLIQSSSRIVYDAVNDSINIEIICNATHKVQVQNVSLYITKPNSNEFFLYDTTYGNSNKIEGLWNLELANANYKWQCLAYTNETSSNSTSNITISKIGVPIIDTATIMNEQPYINSVIELFLVTQYAANTWIEIIRPDNQIVNLPILEGQHIKYTQLDIPGIYKVFFYANNTFGISMYESNFTITVRENGRLNRLTCSHNWMCTEWSTCINLKKTRICTDYGNCNDGKNKPKEEISCLYVTDSDYNWTKDGRISNNPNINNQDKANDNKFMPDIEKPTNTPFFNKLTQNKYIEFSLILILISGVIISMYLFRNTKHTNVTKTKNNIQINKESLKNENKQSPFIDERNTVQYVTTEQADPRNIIAELINGISKPIIHMLTQIYDAILSMITTMSNKVNIKVEDANTYINKSISRKRESIVDNYDITANKVKDVLYTLNLFSINLEIYALQTLVPLKEHLVKIIINIVIILDEGISFCFKIISKSIQALLYMTLLLFSSLRIIIQYCNILLSDSFTRIEKLAKENKITTKLDSITTFNQRAKSKKRKRQRNLR